VRVLAVLCARLGLKSDNAIHLEAASGMAQLAQMHLLTLHFDDPKLEAELCRGRLFSSHYMLAVFWSLVFVFVRLTGYQKESVEVVLHMATFALGIVVAGCFHAVTYAVGCTDGLMTIIERRLEPRISLHTFLSVLYVSMYVLNVGVWWSKILNGTHQRIRAKENMAPDINRIIAMCGLWVLVLILQHIMHVKFSLRMVVLGLALSIVATSEIWKELLMAVVIGEVLGFTLEHNMRVAFLMRAQSLESVQQAKERAVYDMMIAKQQAQRALQTNSQELTTPFETLDPRVVGRERAGCGGSYRDDVSEGGSSSALTRDKASSVSDSNPELVALLSNSSMSMTEAHVMSSSRGMAQQPRADRIHQRGECASSTSRRGATQKSGDIE
jgi:hypothetical protein